MILHHEYIIDLAYRLVCVGFLYYNMQTGIDVESFMVVQKG